VQVFLLEIEEYRGNTYPTGGEIIAFQAILYLYFYHRAARN
jgi:hypothetical protein